MRENQYQAGLKKKLKSMFPGCLVTVYAIAKDERRSDMVATARRLKEKEGMNNSEIGRKMGINESSVRSLLDPNSESKMKQARETAEFLKKQVDKKKMVDVGAGVERDLKVHLSIT